MGCEEPIPIKDLKLEIEKIPNDNYTCPYCDQVPEILSIKTDIGYMDISCKNHGKMTPSVIQYFKEEVKNINQTKLCDRCHKNCQIDQETPFQFCYECQKNLCERCFKKHDDNHNFIEIQQKVQKCLKHPDQPNFSKFCISCNENVCLFDLENHKEKGCKIVDLDTTTPTEEQLDILKNKMEELKVISKIIQAVLFSYKLYPNNYFHRKNVINLANSILNEKKEKELIREKLEQNWSKNLQNFSSQEKAIKELKKAFNIYVSGSETELDLKNRNLNDDAIDLLGDIEFANLLNLNLSFNQISDIGKFEKFKTPKLKTLDLESNKIKEIKALPAVSLNLQELKNLNLKSNLISDPKPLKEAIFAKLESLDITNNNIQYELDEFQQIIKLVPVKIRYKATTYADFYEKYHIENYDLTKLRNNTINLDGYKIGDDGLDSLYLMKFDFSNIKTIDFCNNEITNINIFRKFNLANLENLFLSFNKIIDISIFGENLFPKLEKLDLKGNEIKDISVFYPLKLEKLVLLYISSNNIDYQSERSQTILNYLKGKKIYVHYKVEE